MVQRFIDLEDTPLCLLFGTFECQRVLLTFLRGGLFAPLPTGFRRLWPPLVDCRLVARHLTCKRNRLNGLCHKKRLFHGMLHSYATPLARDAIDVEALRTPYWSVDLHRDHDFAALGCGRWSLIIVK